jgi:hypothetical protein
MLTKEEHDFYEVTGLLTYELHGFKCTVKKDFHLRHLCGYVALPKEHPFYGMFYDHMPISCHGGLSYGRIQNDDLHHIGFDCAHYLDAVPGLTDFKYSDLGPEYAEIAAMMEKIEARLPKREETYKDLSYVKKEIESMVRQIKMVEYDKLTYKKACKMKLLGKSLFFKNPWGAGIIGELHEYKSLAPFIVENAQYYYQTPAEIMSSQWYLLKEAEVLCEK